MIWSLTYLGQGIPPLTLNCPTACNWKVRTGRAFTSHPSVFWVSFHLAACNWGRDFQAKQLDTSPKVDSSSWPQLFTSLLHTPSGTLCSSQLQNSDHKIHVSTVQSWQWAMLSLLPVCSTCAVACPLEFWCIVDRPNSSSNPGLGLANLHCHHRCGHSSSHPKTVPSKTLCSERQHLCYLSYKIWPGHWDTTGSLLFPLITA